MIRSVEADSIRRSFDGLLPSPELQNQLGVVGVGIDVCSVETMEELLKSPRFVLDVFTSDEIIYCSRGSRMRAQRFAARFAGKEAVVKSLGGIDNGDFREIEIIHDQKGKPVVLLSGSAIEKATELGVEKLMVSLTHEKSLAAAICIAIGKK